MNQFKAKLLTNLPSLVVIAGLLLLRSLGLLQNLELAALDGMMQRRPLEPIDDRVVIIGIDEADIQRIQRYPLSDQILAETLTRLDRLKPAAIGLDIFRDFAIEPGKQQFGQAVQMIPNLFLVYRYTPDAKGIAVPPPAVSDPEQGGFADLPLDADGNVRRLLLGFESEDGRAQFSLSVRLSEAWLATQAGSPTAREYPFITRQFGAYQDLDEQGDQLLLNPRHNPRAFRQFSLTDVRTGKLRPADIQGKVVLVGVTAISIKDVVNSAAFPQSENGQVNGVELQAHAVSQLISAVHDRRPLIQSWEEHFELIWIVVGGVAGLLLGRLSPSVGLTGAGVVVGFAVIGGVSYGLLWQGWWIPVVPTILAFGLNASGFVVAQIYQQERDLRLQLRDRQAVLEQTFTAVHNGPLQDLAGLTRQLQDRAISQATGSPVVIQQLQKINEDLRQIFVRVEREIRDDRPQLTLGSAASLNLELPLHELLQQVYNATCANELAGLSQIKVKVIQFDPLSDADLSLEQKRSLCRFLEEALRNVGKHARSATKLWVYCGVEHQRHTICVKDNGSGLPPHGRSGSGTKQAQKLATQLKGQFQRRQNEPQGLICQLTWSVR